MEDAMAKVSKKPIPAAPATTPPVPAAPPTVPAGKIHSVESGELNWTIGISLTGKSVVAEGSDFSKAAAKANQKRHFEKAQDELRKMQEAIELAEYLDEAAAKSESNVAPPVAVEPAPSRKAGRPKKATDIVADAKQMIANGTVKPTPKGLTKFSKKLATPTVDFKTIRNQLRSDWNAALAALKCTKLK
jgi:hypothetical protein